MWVFFFFFLTVSRSTNDNDYTVVSIFVNPSQFAPHEDLDAYPRTIDEDLQALSSVKSPSQIALFLPTVSEMYPSGITLDTKQQRGAFVEVKGLSEQLEGSIRPQFFRGVATVVTKLLNIVTPDRAYFGQKDIQQLIVIKRLVKDLLINTEIVMVPTVRESSNLAMSSRNAYLTEDSREKSAVLYKALAAGESVYKHGNRSRSAILDAINKELAPYSSHSDPNYHIDVEYVSIADKTNLQELTEVSEEGAVLSSAIRVPNKSGTQTRIIDNLIL